LAGGGLGGGLGAGGVGAGGVGDGAGGLGAGVGSGGGVGVGAGLVGGGVTLSGGPLDSVLPPPLQAAIAKVKHTAAPRKTCSMQIQTRLAAPGSFPIVQRVMAGFVRT
jgi:hypothetical protein